MEGRRGRVARGPAGGRGQASRPDLSHWHLARGDGGGAGELGSSCIIECLVPLSFGM